MKRTLALILSALMLSSALLACAKNDDGSSPSTTAQNPTLTSPTEETTDPTKDANGYLLDALPKDLNFQEEEVGILYWSNVEMQEFEADEITGEIINDAIYKRNEQVQNRLNVKFAWNSTPGANGTRAEFLQFVQKSVQAGEKAYDIIGAYSRVSAMLALNGLSYDLNQVKYLDFEKPWWPERMLDTCTIGNSLYFVSGDISTNVLHFMYGIYYNKDMLVNHSLPDPTEMVLNKTWTLDKMIELTRGLYDDLNGNGMVDTQDQFGMTTLDFHCDAFYTGSGLRLVEKDDEALLKISPDFSSEKCATMVEKLGAWAATDDVQQGENNGTYETTFVNGTCLLCLNRMYLADRKLRDVGFSYGVLPVPLYDDKQENYITVMGNPFSLYSITSDCENPDMAAAVLEAMGSAGYRLTTPAIFETNMKVKYSENDINAKMFDIIRENVDFDLGRLFSNDLSYMSELPSKAIFNHQNWASTSATYVKVLNTQIGKIVKKLSALE